MSTLNAALTYKLQKMERTLSSLMEENAILKRFINKNILAEDGVLPGANPHMPNIPPPTTTPTLPPPTTPLGPGGLPKNMVATNPTFGGANTQAFNGAYLGQLLAAGDMRAAQAYLDLFAAQPTGVQTATPTVSPTATQMRMPLSQTGIQSTFLGNPTATRTRR